MKTLRRRWLKLGTLLGASALLWSCVAPMFPVPPPSEVGFASKAVIDGDGSVHTEWIASGGPVEQAANADYYVFDTTVGDGVIATARNDGSFTAPAMQGNPGDRVLVNYRTPYGVYSDSLCVLLGPGASAAPCP